MSIPTNGIQVAAPSSKGKNVFFTSGSKTNADKLEEGLTALDLASFAPKQNSKLVALHQALKSVCGSKHRLVRPLIGERGYAIVKETKDGSGQSLSHGVDFDALMPHDSDFPVFRDSTGNYFQPDEGDRIIHRFQVEKERVQAAAISKALVNIIDKFHGTSLRPSGGIYWLPQGAIETFDKVAKCFQDACEDGTNKIYFQTTVLDDDLTESVIAGLTQSVEMEVNQMTADLRDNNPGKRAKKTKAERCNRLLARIAGYEKMFSVSLKELQAQVSTVEGQAMMATFSTMGV